MENRKATAAGFSRSWSETIEITSVLGGERVPFIPGISNCLGGTGTDTCEDCLANADVRFQFRISNDVVLPTMLPQVFELEIFTGNSLAEMDAQIPMSIVYPTDTTLTDL